MLYGRLFHHLDTLGMKEWSYYYVLDMRSSTRLGWYIKELHPGRQTLGDATKGQCGDTPGPGAQEIY
ncbi:unnamed protein product [Acanthoscelides obtectus]|uniref:Uncharacterized protein n=1 Tax=Acanthoscelides obtectus TaxID=200917 RepID=A0A9P0P013_ACAOB|nr:unnamed protein product [Acanthoscelides obtectus]CAK1633868.1 hypothetical protein AOBTE_LOCUS8449 [Acanthoscelides obtectus]